MDLEFTVTETITSNYNQVQQIQYQFEELTYETVSLGITTKKEERSRIYDANITREQYETITRNSRGSLSFDDFLYVLRPFIMGYYGKNELENAFAILDKDQSGTIDINELSAFLQTVNQYATTEALKNYISRVNLNIEGQINFNEFRSLILKGLGREIICNHL